MPNSMTTTMQISLMSRILGIGLILQRMIVADTGILSSGGLSGLNESQIFWKKLG